MEDKTKLAKLSKKTLQLFTQNAELKMKLKEAQDAADRRHYPRRHAVMSGIIIGLQIVTIGLLVLWRLGYV